MAPEDRWTSVLAINTGDFTQNVARNGWMALNVAPIANAFFAEFIPVNSRAATVVVIHLGTNDWGLNNTLGGFRSDYQAIMAAIAGAQVICVTPTERFQEFWCGDCGKVGGTLEGFRQVIREECTGAVVEGPLVVPVSSPWFANGNFADLVHPSAQGHALLATAIQEAE